MQRQSKSRFRSDRDHVLTRALTRWIEDRGLAAFRVSICFANISASSAVLNVAV